MDRVEEILNFWFGADEAERGDRDRVWFVANPAFDHACVTRFLADHERAAVGDLSAWMNQPRSCLALILLLDQFPRNMFRGTPRAFATDSNALGVARHAIARGFDTGLAPIERSFVYLPIEHSEKLDDQIESMRLFRALADADPALAGYVDYADQHLDEIRRFGRFPHRNAILGRPSTPDEVKFLTGGI